MWKGLCSRGSTFSSGHGLRQQQKKLDDCCAVLCLRPRSSLRTPRSPPVVLSQFAKMGVGEEQEGQATSRASLARLQLPVCASPSQGSVWLSVMITKGWVCLLRSRSLPDLTFEFGTALRAGLGISSLYGRSLCPRVGEQCFMNFMRRPRLRGIVLQSKHRVIDGSALGVSARCQGSPKVKRACLAR